ncbi:protein GET1 isoform X2 [Oryza brachyantha]|uniref:protein GET1 isoform X2 n=1 Tax=Oryza brachyantha TaxID=4533 RepID=UPI001AD98744|nr:protein GET1 isoform X2 [Oryza brachyantha]
MSLAATFVFLLVSALQMLDRALDLAKKRGSITDQQLKLRLEITQILKEASALSTPSTFAQAAKLKRLAAAKEKELAKLQEQDIKGKQSLYNQYGRVLLFTKPFGRMFSWRGVDAATGHVMVGILPWLFLTSRVSKLLCQKLAPIFLHP